MRNRATALLAALLTMLVGTITLAAPANAETYGEKWEQATVYVYDGTKHAQDWQVSKAVRAWDDVTPLKVVMTRQPDKANITVTEGSFDDPSWVAAAERVVQGTAITSCSIVAASKYESYPDSTQLNAIVHEFGHCLGLAHTTVVDAVMYPVVRMGVTYSTPRPFDISELATLYGTGTLVAPNKAGALTRNGGALTLTRSKVALAA